MAEKRDGERDIGGKISPLVERRGLSLEPNDCFLLCAQEKQARVTLLSQIFVSFSQMMELNV